jgi:hypothetical protein
MTTGTSTWRKTAAPPDGEVGREVPLLDEICICGLGPELEQERLGGAVTCTSEARGEQSAWRCVVRSLHRRSEALLIRNNGSETHFTALRHRQHKALPIHLGKVCIAKPTLPAIVAAKASDFWIIDDARLEGATSNNLGHQQLWLMPSINRRLLGGRNTKPTRRSVICLRCKRGPARHHATRTDAHLRTTERCAQLATAAPRFKNVIERQTFVQGT